MPMQIVQVLNNNLKLCESILVDTAEPVDYRGCERELHDPNGNFPFLQVEGLQPIEGKIFTPHDLIAGTRFRFWLSQVEIRLGDLNHGIVRIGGLDFIAEAQPCKHAGCYCDVSIIGVSCSREALLALALLESITCADAPAFNPERNKRAATGERRLEEINRLAAEALSATAFGLPEIGESE